MGKLIKSLPTIYYEDENKLQPFIESLDISLEELEAKVGDLNTFFDIDRCPDQLLPYLASLTGVPLSGSSSFLWRKQIRNWPYILRHKGTLRSLQLYLLSLGVPDYEVFTYWRDAAGNYVTEKPAGEPIYEAGTDLWYNIRTHYYGLRAFWNDEAFSVFEDLLGDGFRFVDVERLLSPVVPFHAELLHFIWGFYFVDQLEWDDSAPEAFHFNMVFPLFDMYPWGGLRYGCFEYGDMLRYGQFDYGDAFAHYGHAMPGSPRYGQDMPDLLFFEPIQVSKLVDTYTVPSVYGEIKYHDFQYGRKEGPQDFGIELTLKKPLIYGDFAYGDGMTEYGPTTEYGVFSYGGGVMYGGDVYKEVV